MTDGAAGGSSTVLRVLIAAILVLLAPACVAVGAPAGVAGKDADPTYVGSQACAGCHGAQFAAWQGSHHDLAMQPANSETVLGDFSDANFVHSGVTTRFFKRDERFFVNTEDASGESVDFEIAYTFGVEPLQQYLVRFSNGALQALGVAWDTRPVDQGGQRWFHVYGDEPIPHTDELHWTGRAQTWNYQCADCHSLNVRKNYDSDTDSYATTWSVIDVGCEGCHGPGAEHVRLAPTFGGDGSSATGTNKGLTHTLNDRSDGRWTRANGERIAHRTSVHDDDIEVNTCARCHSRRAQLRERPYTGQPFLDDYRPALLTPGLYHADGQIDDEVYVYGSFLQSRMHQAGVVCSDCHDPHSGRIRAKGNELCAGCHAPEIYDIGMHHHHPQGSAGAQCVECHMPTKNYMVIDARRDHSIRVPRPDLSARLGTPNACNQCHSGKTPEWAADHVVAWRGEDGSESLNYGVALATLRSNVPEAGRIAMALVNDDAAPAIVRATAAQTLGRYPPRATLETLVAAASDEDGLVRIGAIDAVGSSVAPLRLQIALPNLYDDLLSIRIAAASVLARLPAEQIPEQVRASFEQGADEYVAAQRLQADHPGALANLGSFFTDRGELDQAELAYQQALRISPGDVRATIGLADLYRVRADDAQAVALLRRALKSAPERPELHHALGLALVRQKDRDAALEHLTRAAALAPQVRRYLYVLAVARRSYGQPAAALAGLEPVFYRYPNDVQMIMLLAELHDETGNHEQAIEYAERLVELIPDDPRASEFLQGLLNSGE